MNQKVIKPGIVRRMVERIESSGQSVSPEMADMCITAFLDTVADILSEGDTAILRGYMTIYPKYCKSKEVKNVMDKSRVTIPAHYKAGIKAGLEGLAGKVPGLVDVKVNINGLPTSTVDVMLDTTFTDADALKAYSTNPLHVAVADGKVRPYTAVRSCLDYEV